MQIARGRGQASIGRGVAASVGSRDMFLHLILRRQTSADCAQTWQDATMHSCVGIASWRRAVARGAVRPVRRARCAPCVGPTWAKIIFIVPVEPGSSASIQK